MTTADFINRTFGVHSERERACSSVWADQHGNIYSYGRHYPLLFKIGGLTFRNRVGYSNTTAKHINWAGGFGATDVWLQGCNQYTWRNSENAARVPHLLSIAAYGMTPELEAKLKDAIITDLEAERADIQERMDAKTRHDTQIYRMLTEEYADCAARLSHVRNAWGLV